MSDQPTSGKTTGDMAQEILNRIVTDADFRQQIANNPTEALTQAGYWAGDDVSGYSLRLTLAPTLGPDARVQSPTLAPSLRVEGPDARVEKPHVQSPTMGPGPKTR